MKKILSIFKVLFYYDQPEIFLARDVFGINYICLAVEIEGDLRYISVPISNSRLELLLKGEEDLRAVFENPEAREWYLIDKFASEMIAEFWNVASVSDDYLPDPGFVFDESEIEDNEIWREVVERNNTVIHLAVSDKYDSRSIEVSHLSDVIRLYQSVVENCYKKTISTFEKGRRKKEYLDHRNYKLRAFDSSMSSFNIHLYSNSQSDLFGNTLIEYSLKVIDNIFIAIDTEESLLELLRKVKGHTLSSLDKMMKKIVESEINIKYKWMSPSRYGTQFLVIDKAKAQKISDILSRTSELVEEIVSLAGYFVQIDGERGTWRIYNREDDKEYAGESDPSLLSGVTVITVDYQIRCIEKIVELEVSGKEKISYSMQEILEKDRV